MPDEIDRCNNTYGDLTVDEDGCADCGYLETDDELRAWLEELENEGDLDEFKASLDEHEAFIEEAITANPQAKWKIVVWHYSIYSAAMHSTDDQSEGIRYLFTPMLEDLDIDVVLMGHDHAYTKTYQMLGNEPQLDQMVTQSGKVINPTGILYLTASSSSGSKYYDLNCNIGDETSDSAVYYNYAAVYYEDIPTFTYFDVDDNTLKFKTFSYSLVEEEESGTSEYVPVLIDEYAMEKKPPRWKKGWWGWCR
ncbi:MAG: metallophosphoesterase [Deltaproteobacteria bacterium]|nr:metallophosphoesterase [Deltaproteobacteria bacterium]